MKSLLQLRLTSGLAIILSGASLAPAGTFVPPANNRVDINFNADWLYVQGDVSGAQDQAFNDSGWTSVGLPHTTKFVTPENPTAYLGVSWYRKHFTVSSNYQGRKVFIEFGAAMQTADVYINGTLAVHHDGGYTPFTADATSLVNYGGADNVIAVRIDSTPNGNIPPGNSNPDFQYHGGLYRDVKLHITDPLHVTDAVYANRVGGGGIFVTYPSVTSGSAAVNVKTDVLNENGTAQSATVVSALVDANSNVVVAATNTVSIPAGTNYAFNQNLVVASPNLWHPYNPYLYTLHTVVQKGATAVDYLKTRVGIRTIQWTHDNGFLINGVQFKARGANFHQDIYGEGNAMPDRTVYYDVKRLKDVGFDFVRCSHYPHHTAFYDACDQLGVLTMDSVPGWQYYNDSTTFRNNTCQDCRDMIRRDRNHPSIVVWETSLNEAGFTTAWATNMQTIAHAEYPGNQTFTAGWTTTVFDLLCSSSQAGVRSSTDTRPIIIDEYGDWDYGGNSSTSRVAREGADTNLLVQCNNWQESLNANLALNWFSADAVWDFTDYTGYLSTTTKCGVMDHYRLPKFSYFFYQSQRDPTVSIPNVQSGPMVYIANTHQTNSPTAIRVFSNCQQVSLYTNGILFATQSPDTTYPNLPHPPFTFNLTKYINGPIRADGITNGTVACSFSRLVPASPSQIVLQTEGMDPLSADGGDARLVFVSVVDANAQVVPNATNTVNLSVSGHGKIIGPTAIQMKGGQLATWIQSGRAAGTVMLTASGMTLSPASLTLTNQAVPNIDPLPAPAVPTGLTVALGQSSLTLNWNPAACAFTYNVKSSTSSGGPYNVIASNVFATSYTMALDGTNYYFVVSAVNEAGLESANSAEAVNLVPGSLISLVNPGFETNTSGAVITVKVNKGYDVSTNDVAGWKSAGTTYRDSGVDYAGDGGNVAVHGGSVTAYCDQGDSGACQIVGYQMQTGDQITLTWWAKSSYNNAAQNVKLLSAATPSSTYSSLTQLTNSTEALNDVGNGGAYTQYILNYTATAGDAGKYIAVSFASPGTRGSWAMFDDFNLSVLSIPAAPGGLTATPGNGQVGLSWSAVPNASGYYIKRSLVSGGSYNNIATNSANLTFTDAGLANGTTYYHVVSAFNQAGAGTNSAQVSAVPLPPLPAIPTGLTAQASNGQINLSWNASAYATGYNVFRSLIPGGFDTRLANNIASTNHTDTSAVSGTPYYYSVTATNMAGQSDFSSQASATVQAMPPTFGSISLSGTNLIVNGTNGTAGMNYLILTSTNLTLPLANWTELATNTFGPGGGFNFTNPLNPARPQQFFRLTLP
jgi:fibronectin type 3 domain-containing protein